ncbi:MAG: MFS transporter [Paludibacteraceae bacterium]|nr:MFS transporter [Paludibacteraceae bacterium]
MKNKNTLPIIMMIALFFMIAFVTGLQNPFGVIAKSQFNASNLMSQLGNFANFIAYACMGIPAGLILQRKGYKITSLIAVSVGLLGVVVMYLAGFMGSATYAIYLCGAFISGFSMCILNTVCNPMLNTLAGGGKKGNQLIQIGGVFGSTGATLAPVLVGMLMGNAANRTIQDANPALWLAMTIFALAFVVLYFIDMPEPHLNQQQVETKDKYSAFSFRHFNLGIIAIFIYVGVEVGIPNIANLYMTTDIGMDTAVAGTIVGTYWFLMLVGRFIGASIGGYISSKTMLIATTTIAALLVISAILLPQSMVNMPVFRSDISFGIEAVPVNILLLILCGLCTSVMWGAIFNLAVEGLGKYTAAASGIFMMMVCGGGVLPLIQGLVADNFGFINSYYVVFLGIIYMLIYAIYGSKLKVEN